MKVIGWILTVWGALAAVSYVMRTSEVQESDGDAALVIALIVAIGMVLGGTSLIRRAGTRSQPTIPPMPAFDEAAAPTDAGLTDPMAESPILGSEARGAPAGPWKGIAVGTTAVALISLILAGQMLGQDDDSVAAGKASAQPDVALDNPPAFKVAGTIFIPSPTARMERTWNGVDYYYKDCVGVDRDEPERDQVEAARLSLFSGDGSALIGAAGATDRATLSLGGRGICGWRVRFKTTLPGDTDTFMIGYGSSRLGPYSQADATRIRLTLTP
jgi:hypothetical protein